MASSSHTTAPAQAEAHPARLQHHFVSFDQQFDAAKMGMWLFLVTEVLLFTGMFVAYTVYRVWHPEVFAVGATLLDPWLGGLNTVVLLASSFTVALGVRSIQKGNQKALLINILLTMAGAAIFLVVKYFEYTHKFHLGIFPGEHYNYAEVSVPRIQQFFSIYFVMTGIHGLHVLIGIGLFVWLAFRAARGHFSAQWYTPVELVGLYWHIVDIIWIFLFPLLYLI